jgi:rod shape-determining protein MreD
MMQPVRYLAAFISIGVLALLAALPWGLPPDDRFFLPLLPVVAIHYWSLRHPGLVPEWYVFLAGLLLDVLTHGPLGYWPLVYLTAHMAAVLSAPLASRGVMMRLALFGFALIGVVATAWMIASVYFLERADIGPYAIGAALAALSAGLLIPLFHVFDPDPGTRENVRLERGV